MKTQLSSHFINATVIALFLLAPGCARRMTVATGTTIGLHATPGDGKSQTPQVTLAYKRSELALVPTGEKAAKKKADENSDAYSAIAVIDFQTKWFGRTSIDQFIATGHASRDIQEPGSEFTQALAFGGSIRDDVVEASVFQALSRVAATDREAALCVRDLNALGELEPDKYTYITIPANPPPPFKRMMARRPAAVSYTTFVNYRARLKSTLNILKGAAPINVTEMDGSVSALDGDALKNEIKEYELALNGLQKRVAERGATQRALKFYVEAAQKSK